MRVPSQVLESQASALMLWMTFRCVFWSRVSAASVADAWHHKPPKHEELLSGTLSDGQDSHTGSCRPLRSWLDRALLPRRLVLLDKTLLEICFGLKLSGSFEFAGCFSKAMQSDFANAADALLIHNRRESEKHCA